MTSRTGRRATARYPRAPLSPCAPIGRSAGRTALPLPTRMRPAVFTYPGWSKPVLQLLYEQRGITASGHETTDTDPGLQTTKDDYSLESYILGLNHYQIELLANLDQVPEAGAIVSVTWPKADGGTGFPARVIAIIP